MRLWVAQVEMFSLSRRGFSIVVWGGPFREKDEGGPGAKPLENPLEPRTLNLQITLRKKPPLELYHKSL